jgi:predicted RNA-binding protein with TRAM domain
MKGKKTGGRSAGTPNRRTEAIRKRVLHDEELTVESTVEAIRRGQNYDIRRLFTKEGNLKALHQLTEEEAWPIAGFEIIIKNAEAGDGHTDKVAKIKLADRRGYVELAAKHQGMLTEKLEVSGEVALIDGRLQAARNRLAGRG